MKSKTAAVVVLYNPNINFINNIYTYIDHVSLLIIVDNSEKPNTPLLEPLSKDPRVKLILNNENTGIAKAINSGIKLASDNNFEWVLTMDQDSYFEKEMIRKYFEETTELTGKSKVAVLGPVTEKIPKDESTKKTTEITGLITSGSLINVAVFNEVGGYTEKLFIDEVDHDYCYRAKISGYSIIQFNNILLQHSLGEKKPVRTVFGKKKIKALHSPLRLYYIVRNGNYIISTYKKIFPEEVKLRRRDLLVRIKNNLFYNPRRLSVLRHIILGFIHYKTNRFGKL